MASTCTYIHVYVQTHVSMYDPYIYIPTLTHTSETGGGKGKKGGKKESGKQSGRERQRNRKTGVRGK